MGLVERDEAIAELDGMLAAAVAGKGRVAVLTGAVAVGKTELLHAFAERAVDGGALAITAAGSHAERNLPLGVMSQLLLDAPLAAEERQRAMNLLYEATRAVSGDGEQLDPQIVHALCTVLLELSLRYPLVIAVDDIDRVDRASIVCLAYLARRVRFSSVLALFAQSEAGSQDEITFEVEALWRSMHGTRIALTALSPDGVQSVAAAVADPDTVQRLVPAWHRLSGGNPLLLDGLLEDHRQAVAEGVVPGAEPPVGAAYSRAVVSCLHRADIDLLPVIRALAVCADPALLEQLLPGDGPRIGRAVRVLTTAGVLAQGEFRHPVAREAVLADITEAERTDLHHRAAVLTHRNGASTTVVAEHLIGAGPIREAWAVPVLEDAARQALREGAVTTAVLYLKLAWETCTDNPRRARIMATLVRAEWRINPSAPTGYLPELTAALREGHLRGGDALVLTKALLWHGQFTDAREVFEHLNRHADEADHELAAELAITRPLLRVTHPSFLPLVRPVDRRAITMPTVGASQRLESANALAAVLTGGPSEQLVSAVERILHTSRLDEMSLDTVESALLALAYGGLPHRAAPWCDLFVEEAGARRAPSRQARLAAIGAEISVRTGDLPRAQRQVWQALTVMPPSSWGVAIGAPLAAGVLAATGIGDFATVRDLLDQPVPEQIFQTRYGLHYLHARGRYSLAIGELPLALRDFRHCGELVGKWRLDTAGLIPWRVDAAETLQRMNEPDQARQLIEEQLGRCGPHATRVQGMALRVFAAAGELRHRPGILRRAADLHTGGDEYELARTLVDLAEAFQSLGEYRRAGMIARRARLIGERAGAKPLLASLTGTAGWDEGELPVPVSPAAGPGGLSEAERRVAALAAAGYSNREIGEKLFVTISTVEQHLTRSFRKLNVTRRTQLPASLAMDFSATA